MMDTQQEQNKFKKLKVNMRPQDHFYKKTKKQKQIKASYVKEAFSCII